MMLLYNKALDPIHTILRIAAICLNTKSSTLEIDRLQILSFLLAFPAHIADMPLGRELLKEKNQFKKYKSPYNNFEPYSLFNRMSPVFFTALHISENIEFILSLENGQLELNKQKIPAKFIELIEDGNSSISKETMTFEINHLLEMPLLGKSGLKAASKLMDYRYDYT